MNPKFQIFSAFFLCIMDYKKKIIECLEPVLGQKIEENLIETPPDPNMGDYGVPMFQFARVFKNSPVKIAEDMANKISLPESFEKVKNIGPYLNFFVKKDSMAKYVLQEVQNNISQFATSHYRENEKSKRIVVEYPSPNTNKPLHLGHVRNMLLGQALSVLNTEVGNKVFQVNLLNDRGIHICKSMWAYEKFGEEKTPEQVGIKSDHFVGNYYVKYAQEEAKLKEKVKAEITQLEVEQNKPINEQDEKLIEKLEKTINESKYGQLLNEIKSMLIKWEKNEPKVRALWRKMNDWAENGYEQTFNLFGIKHDKTYYESQIYDKGKEIVLEGLEKGLFDKLEDGAIIARFTKKGFPKEKVLLRSDGTTLYVTQDLFLGFEKMKDYTYDLSIYVIGNEQDMQLKVVFELLKKLGMKAENLHYSHGMINLTSGKMKSREGTTVDADNIVQELEELAMKEIEIRYEKIGQKEKEYRARKIAMAALRFFILKYDYSRDFLFDPEKSIAFEGETGPYILYSYARICAIFRKAMEMGIEVPYDPVKDEINSNFSINEDIFQQLAHEMEVSLLEHLYKYPTIVSEAAAQLKPHLIARTIYEIAQEFTKFYHACPIVKESEDLRKARLYLADAVRLVIKHALFLLTIDVLNEM